ncbi:MAG: sensor histidine kinase, partial [Proteobacteria bacterium]|nr:sensor histidine kinase [Pseudomonadota bacterium]
PMLFGMPVERFVLDASDTRKTAPAAQAPTSLLDLQKIPDISSQIFAGPAAEFADVIAGVGLIDPVDPMAQSRNSFLPLARWREDRFVANLALAPRDFLWGVSIRGGRIEIANRPVRSDGGFVLMTPLPHQSAKSQIGEMKNSFPPAEPLDALLSEKPLRNPPELVVIGASNSGAVAQISAIANSAINGTMPVPVSLWSIVMLAIAATIALGLSMAPGLALAMALGFAWILALVVFAPFLPNSITPPAGSIFIASAIPVLFETIRRSRLRDLRMRKMAMDLSATHLAKSAMAQQARMVVHDLRRVVKFSDPANAAYLDGFLVELAALDESVDRKSNLTSKSFSIVDLTEASLSRLLPSFGEKGLEFKVSWAHHSRMAGDPLAMRRIVDNLLENAASSAPRDSTISIRTREIAMQQGDGTV